MPRQASPATRAAASALGDRAASPESQNRALTWAIPTRDTASSRDASSGSPVSSRMTCGDHRRALVGDPVDPLADGRLVGQVGLEDQPERAGLAGDVVEEGVHRRLDALLVVVGRLQRGAAVVDDQRRRRCRAARGRARACRGSAGRAPAWRRRRARRCRPSRRRGSPARRRPRAPTRAAGRGAACAAAGRRAGAAPPRRCCSRRLPASLSVAGRARSRRKPTRP